MCVGGVCVRWGLWGVFVWGGGVCAASCACHAGCMESGAAVERSSRSVLVDGRNQPLGTGAQRLRTFSGSRV